MVRTQSLAYTYPPDLTIRFPDMVCRRGEHWLILGPSGCGKTTLLQLLAGLRHPHEGKVFIGDTELTALRGRARDLFRGQHIGLVFQQPHFVAALTVLENLLLPQKLARRTPSTQRALALLDELGVAHKAHALPHRLSQGEQQRVAIARALVNEPVLILADEPTSALDDGHAAAVADLLEREARSVQATLLIVTHDNRLKTRFPHRLELHKPAAV
ncbi:MAG: ATP-binding cassette domain-containing protein [Bacteroidetes bacterium]|nr:MAG: ATP-binding cassette domain-containing protein [Bacteroidota bacterium]